MPDVSTHAGIGVGTGYYVGVVLSGFDPSYFITGVVGAMLSAGRKPPEDFIKSDAKAWLAVFGVMNIVGAGCLTAWIVTILVKFFPSLYPIALPVSGLIGYLSTEIVAMAVDVLRRIGGIISARYGKPTDNQGG